MHALRHCPRLRGARSATGRAARAGFTLVELIVAMSFLSIGLLAVAGLAMTAIRSTKRGASQTLAAALAQSRIDSLASLPCAAILPTGSRGTVGGTSTYRGIRERWTAKDTVEGNMLAITDTLTVTGRATPMVFLSMRACR